MFIEFYRLPMTVLQFLDLNFYKCVKQRKSPVLLNADSPQLSHITFPQEHIVESNVQKPKHRGACYRGASIPRKQRLNSGKVEHIVRITAFI